MHKKTINKKRFTKYILLIVLVGVLIVAGVGLYLKDIDEDSLSGNLHIASNNNAKNDVTEEYFNEEVLEEESKTIGEGFNDILTNDMSVPGLYQNQSLTNSWDELIKSGKVCISGKTLSSVCNLLEGELVLDNSIEKIDSWALSNCSKITGISMPDALTDIGGYAFYKCSKIECINIPDGVKTLGDAVFYGCSSLKTIKIGKGLTSIGDFIVIYCGNLENIIVDEENPTYDSRNNCNAIIEKQTKTLVLGCKTTVIPTDIQNLGVAAFYTCTGLTEIVIPDNIVVIEKSAFLNCTNLSKVTISEGVRMILDFAFSDCVSLTSIMIPSTVTYIDYTTFCNCGGLKNIVVDSDNTIYDSRGNCNAIIDTAKNVLIVGCENTVILDEIKEIGDWAFYGRIGLVSITIPSSVTRIGIAAFSGCWNLTTITIPSSVEEIGIYAFRDCKKLENGSIN